MGATRMTTDHAEVRQWAMDRGGVPAHLSLSSDPRAKIGILKIRLPGVNTDEPLRNIDWEAWFRVFDRQRLAFLYEDEQAHEVGEGDFYKVVSRARIGCAAYEESASCALSLPEPIRVAWVRRAQA